MTDLQTRTKLVEYIFFLSSWERTTAGQRRSPRSFTVNNVFCDSQNTEKLKVVSTACTLNLHCAGGEPLAENWTIQSNSIPSPPLKQFKRFVLFCSGSPLPYYHGILANAQNSVSFQCLLKLAFLSVPSLLYLGTPHISPCWFLYLCSLIHLKSKGQDKTNKTKQKNLQPTLPSKDTHSSPARHL